MGYLSCRAESSISTCRSLSAVATNSSSSASTSSSSSRRRFKSKKNVSDATSTAVADGRGEEESTVADGRLIQHFTYHQLESATGNFSDDSLLGRGSHGSVYKARLPSGRVFAVKRPSRVRHRHTPVRAPPPGGGGGSTTSTTTTSTTTTSSSRLFGRSEVENEIEVLSRVQGPRLVNLIGFTTTTITASEDNSMEAHGPPSSNSSFSSSFRKDRLLVMEYMPNGTLYDLLHSNPRPPGWARRLRLALQTAKAVSALHSHDPVVVHRDIKSANILLDDGLNARLGDFGLAVCFPKFISPTDGRGSGSVFHSLSFLSTPPAGTLGYLDPGYITPENLSTKTDVFSFGILLLEIMSGRKAIDVAHSPPSIVEWATPLMRRGKVLTLYDPRISPPRDPVARRQLAALAATCVRSSADRRPSMEEVVERLKVLSKTVPSKPWTGLSVGNPCSAIEIERNTCSEPSFSTDKQKCKCNSIPECNRCPSTRGSVDLEEDTLRRPLPVNPVRISRSARRVFSEAGYGGRNLMDLLKAPDEDTIRVLGVGLDRNQLSGSFKRGKGVSLSQECGDRNEQLEGVRRNRCLKDAFEAMSVSDNYAEQDENPHTEEILLSSAH